MLQLLQDKKRYYFVHSIPQNLEILFATLNCELAPLRTLNGGLPSGRYDESSLSEWGGGGENKTSIKNHAAR